MLVTFDIPDDFEVDGNYAIMHITGKAQGIGRFQYDYREDVSFLSLAKVREKIIYKYKTIDMVTRAISDILTKRLDIEEKKNAHN